jgi:hypothetical protein
MPQASPSGTRVERRSTVLTQCYGMVCVKHKCVIRSRGVGMARDEAPAWESMETI